MPNSKTKSGFLLNIENWFRYRRFPYPKRSVEFVALIAVSCTFFLFMHTKNLNSKLHEMETKLQPSELSALGLSGGNSIINDNAKHHDLKGLHSTYQYLKSTGQLYTLTCSQLNNSKKAEIDYLIFNRVPKVGSQSMMMLMRSLGNILGYAAVRDKPKMTEDVLMNNTLQEEFITDILENPMGSVYSKHTAYVDFQEFGYGKPIYINLIRDPVERVISWYYYVRAPWYYIEMVTIHKDYPLPDVNWIKKDFEDCVMDPNDKECSFIEGSWDGTDHRRQTLFFCGQDKQVCMPLNTLGALQKAKENVEKEYAVVGSWDEPNVTLSVLEHYVPRYFRGAMQYYHKYKDTFEEKNKNKFKPSIPEYVKDMVRKNLTREMEFYEFCKQRLYKQYIVLLEEKKIDDNYFK